MEYKYDIFISYKWGDDRKEWVDNIFVPLLKKVIFNQAGTDCRIFKDTDDIVYGASLPNSLRDAVAHSKCMVSIISLPYFTSSVWCPTEFSAMLYREGKIPQDHVRHQGLIFPVLFVDTAAKANTDKSPVYKKEQLRDLIFNKTPLELDEDKYNYTTKNFLKSKRGRELENLVEVWVNRSIIPRLQSIPDWSQEWLSDEFLSHPFVDFKGKYDLNPLIPTMPKMI